MKTLYDHRSFFVILFTLLFPAFCACGKSKDVDPPLPEVRFLYSVDVRNMLKVHFITKSQNGVSYLWDFGDGTQKTSGKSLSHTYASAGVYNVTLTAKNQSGASNIQKKSITIKKRSGLSKNIKLSILGDSYSTFSGFVDPDLNEVWYPNSENKNDVLKVEQTWWHLLLTEREAVIEKNNSYSGSTICNTGYDGDNSSHTSFITRMKNIGNPEMIIIFGGTNDSWANAPIGEFKYENWTENDLKNFRPAFAYMLDYLISQHPQAKIINVINSELKPEITDSQKSICEHYKITCLELQNMNKQSGHPSVSGMLAIKDQISGVIPR